MCTSLTNSTTQQNSAKNARTDTKSVQPGQIGQTHARYHRLLAGYGGRVDAREVGWRRGNSCTCASYTQSNHTRPMTCLRTARHPPGRRTALRSLRVSAAGDPPPETVVVTTTNVAPRPQLKAALEGRSKAVYVSSFFGAGAGELRRRSSCRRAEFQRDSGRTRKILKNFLMEWKDADG